MINLCSILKMKLDAKFKKIRHGVSMNLRLEREEGCGFALGVRASS